MLDCGLGRLADAIAALNGRKITDKPGAGAAGGTGGGMLGLFNATMRPGIELVLDLLHAREACAWADVVITGEGSIDGRRRTARCRAASRDWRNRKENRLSPSEEK